MRVFLLSAAICLVGCASTPESAGLCNIYLVNGSRTPLGLVRLPNELAEQLVRQLPQEDQARYICWYSKGDELVVSERSNPNSFVYAYMFAWQGTSWIRANELPEAVAPPRTIQ
jgi:hypothetical protein